MYPVIRAWYAIIRRWEKFLCSYSSILLGIPLESLCLRNSYKIHKRHSTGLKKKKRWGVLKQLFCIQTFPSSAIALYYGGSVLSGCSKSYDHSFILLMNYLQLLITEMFSCKTNMHFILEAILNVLKKLPSYIVNRKVYFKNNNLATYMYVKQAQASFN